MGVGITCIVWPCFADLPATLWCGRFRFHPVAVAPSRPPRGGDVAESVQRAFTTAVAKEDVPGGRGGAGGWGFPSQALQSTRNPNQNQTLKHSAKQRPCTPFLHMGTSV